MKEIAKYGRNGDTQIGHLTTGEIVVPKGIINLKLQKELQKAFEKQGTDIKRYTVGSSSNSINPITGQPEFFFKKVFRAVGKVFSGAAKVVKKAVKGITSIVKSPAGMAILIALGGAWVASGGLGALFGGQAAGQSAFGQFMSKLGTKLVTPFKGLFPAASTASGGAASTTGLFGAAPFATSATVGTSATGYTAGTSAFMAAPASMAKVAGVQGSIGAVKYGTAASTSFMGAVKKGAVKSLATKGALSLVAPTNVVTLETPSFGDKNAMNRSVNAYGLGGTDAPGVSTQFTTGTPNLFAPDLVGYVNNALGTSNETNAINVFNNLNNSTPAFGYAGGANRYLPQPFQYT